MFFKGKSRWKDYLLLLVIVSLAYFPFTFSIYSADHDFLNCWVPWRYYISSSIEQGIFPWWNPYQQLGYPIHADLQGPLWYPENLLSSYLGIQSVSYLLWVHVLHLWIAGIGMFELCKTIIIDRKYALIGSVLFVLNGFFLAHSMHQYAIYSGAWITVLLVLFIKLFQTRSYYYAFASGVVFFMNFTGGNHTFTIISVYLFGVLGIYFLWLSYRESKLSKDLILLSTYLFVAVCSGLLTIALLFEVGPYIGRLSGMTYENVAYNPFTPQSLLSLINPNSNLNAFDVFQTDQTMSNAYFSIFGLVFFVSSFFRKLSKLEMILLGFALLCLLASFGDATPFHFWMVKLLPGLDKFRFPSYYTFFTILLIIPVAMKTLQLHFQSNNPAIKRILLVLISFSLLQIVYGFFNEADFESFWSTFKINLFELKSVTNFSTNLLVFGLLSLMPIIGYYFAKSFKVWCIFLGLEFVLFLPFAMTHTTMIDKSPIALQNVITSNENPFNQLKLEPINQHNHRTDTLPLFWHTTNVYLKNVTNDGFNSFWFWDLYMLDDSLTRFSNELYKNPVAYLSTQFIPDNQLLDTTIYFDSSYTAICSEDLSLIQGISEPIKSKNIRVLKFNGEGLSFEVSTDQKAVFNLLQTNYPGWNVLVDGNPSRVLKTNFMCMGTVLEKGDHIVEFIYKNSKITRIALLSYALWFLMIILSLLTFKNRKRLLKPTA